MNDLLKKRCVPCEGGVDPLSAQQVTELVSDLDGWRANAEKTEISKNYIFENYYHTMAFVNAIAWMAHQENHHPDLEVGYNHCLVRYSTHAIKGLSENDFICASKVENLLDVEPVSCAI